MLDAALRRRLIDSASIAAFLDVPANRIFAERAPQGLSPPYVIYQPIALEAQAESFDGPSGLVWDRYQIDSYAATVQSAIGLADAVNGTLANYRGTVAVDAATSPPTVVTIQNIRRINRVAIPEEQGAPSVFRRLQEFIIAWNEGV
jgi:hypothetical protein